MLGRSRRRFVLVDPSFDGMTGDKWQYAISFHDSAVKNGFDFVLLGNKTSPSIQSATTSSVDQRNIFQYNFYGHGEIVSRNKPGPRHRALVARDAECNAAITALDGQIHTLDSAGRFVEAARLKAERASCLAAHLQATAGDYAAAAQMEQPVLPFNGDDLALRLSEEIRNLNLRSGDVLFMHTTTQAMLESLAEMWLHMEGQTPIPADAYFLFHFGAEAPDARTFIDRYHSYSHMPTLGLRLRTGSPFKNLYILATNTKLRDELEAQLRLPVALFDGLTNFDRYLDALGGKAAHERDRAAILERASHRDIVLGVRIADLDEDRVDHLRAGVMLLERMGYSPRVRLGHHNGNLGRAAELLAYCDHPAFALVDTENHADYIRFLAASTVMVLPYRPEIYRKRVSAVLHDCSVLGVSCIVPRHSTLEDGRHYADIYTYGEPSELPGIMLRCAHALSADAGRPLVRKDIAATMFTTDVVERLLGSAHEPSLQTERRSPIATVVMPLWGRVGTSHVVEAQIRFLIESGYFVVQVFSLDKPTDLREAESYFWRILFENSREIRGHVQRIAYRSANPSNGSGEARINAFDVYLDNIAANEIFDNAAVGLIRQSSFMLVNHVFNSRLARKFDVSPLILESHDIQSAQMVHWPLISPETGAPERFERLFEKELHEITRFDFVVNLSDSEHKRLRAANANSRMVTPYIPRRNLNGHYESVAALAHAHGWDVCYHEISRFDLLLLGDSHPANVESARWFINEVYRPYLEHRSLRLAIAGRISDTLYKTAGDVPNIFYCGFVDDIQDLRALSDIIVLPDQRGTGISIKTLETLAAGNAYAATSCAFRSIASHLDEPPTTFDRPGDFAGRILDLHRNPAERRAAQDTARAIYDRVASKAIYDAAWREILSGLHLPNATGGDRA